MERTHTCLTALVALLMVGCAGRHQIPDANFASTNGENDVFAVAFDQDGNIYPPAQDHSALNLGEAGTFNWHDHDPSSPFSDKPFQLDMQRDAEGAYYYDDSTREALTAELAADIRAALGDRNILYIFIHGFNNSYASAKSNMELMRAHVRKEDGVELFVYWDGLYRAGASYNPLFRWNKALTYSNLAGQQGLRNLLQQLGRPVDLVFVTHSRGAAVALSTIFDPEYDTHITRPEPLPLPLTTEHVRSVKMVMLAPAVGEGHLKESLLASRDENIPIEIFMSASRADRATCKVLGFTAALDGSSSLGCGSHEKYIESVKARFPEQSFKHYIFGIKPFLSVRYRSSSHSVQTYLKSAETMLCDSLLSLAQENCEPSLAVD